MGTRKILLVDDDRDLVASIEAFLTARGYAVTTANNGKEAYARIVADKPDLIVLDVMMDYDEEGMVLASALKTDGPTRDIPILMLSGFNVQEDVREKVLASLMGQDLPAEVFMQKPCGWPSWPSASRHCCEAPRPGVALNHWRGTVTNVPTTLDSPLRLLSRPAHPAPAGDPDQGGLSIPNCHERLGRFSRYTGREHLRGSHLL